MRWRCPTVVTFASAALFGCLENGPEPQRITEERDLPSRFPAAHRIVAIGDLHGDLEATRTALHLAGALGEGDQWIGGDLVVVQTGDQFDRGNEELEILDLLESLDFQARQEGGAVHALNGNHELMNVELDLRYVTLDGFADFLKEPIPNLEGAEPETVVEAVLARMKSLRPGGLVARRLADRNVVVMVGTTVFAHGGVLPHVAEYGIERLNQETRIWLRGETSGPPDILLATDGPVWSRHFGDDPNEKDCLLLYKTLALLGAERMVVGHTVQDNGITSACDERVWRIDVGLSAHYGGTPAVLELSDGRARVIENTEVTEKVR